MRLSIPVIGSNPPTFLELDITYEVIATSGPPEPPFNVELTDVRFVERWRIDTANDFGLELLDNSDEYYDLETDTVNSPYDEYIENFIRNNYDEIRADCVDFELTNSDSVV